MAQDLLSVFGITPIHPPQLKSQGNPVEFAKSFIHHDEAKQDSNRSSESFIYSADRLKKLEQVSWNTDRTGEVGKWDIARATNFQIDAEKHPGNYFSRERPDLMSIGCSLCIKMTRYLNFMTHL